MGAEHYVIIGNGPAANQAALTLRERSSPSRITMISRERTGYYRPDLLPALVAGEIAEDKLYVYPPDHYRQLDIKLRLGQEVRQVDFDKKELTLDHKEVIRFDGLIIAVGSRPRIPEPLQVFEDLMMTLKTVADASAWIEKLNRIQSVLIIGGDLPSLSFTRALLALGKKISFVVERECLWPVRFTPSLYDELVGKLRQKGVQVIACNKFKNLARVSDDSIQVDTDTGRLQVGAVGAFFGLVPDVKFLVRSGLHIERGILVDEYLQTQFEGVYAAGDCAQVYHPALHDYWVSIGYANARNLGRVAALNLMGSRQRAEAATESIFEVEGIAVNTSWWTEF